MRRVTRDQLKARAATYLQAKQNSVNVKSQTSDIDANKEWNNARKTKAMEHVCSTLRNMMGLRERCMYCLDSHGTDIEHFWPKTAYPDRMFEWLNMLLCCTECGRFKGTSFPIQNGAPLLIDPTAEDPWQHLDFDPDTGNIIARFDLVANEYSVKGMNTVEVLRLDRREALSVGYQRTYRRLSDLVRCVLNGTADSEALPAALQGADDHGLLGWCFMGSGSNIEPFKSLREQHLPIWNQCLDAIERI
jgi:uncharacterized protein (TIGR02646 family)